MRAIILVLLLIPSLTLADPWSLSDGEGVPIHGTQFGDNGDIDNFIVIAAYNVYQRYGDRNFIRPTFKILPVAGNNKFPKYCSVELVPLKVNDTWVKFSSYCNEGTVSLIPSTLGDAGKLRREFVKSNEVEFEGLVGVTWQLNY